MEKDIAELNGKVEMLIVQFKLNRRDLVAECIPHKEEKPAVNRAVPSKPGKKIFDTKKNLKVRIAALPPAFIRMGWGLRNAFYEKRVDSDNHPFWIERYVLVRKEGRKINPAIAPKEPEVEAAFEQRCDEADYHIRIHVNSYFEDGVEVPNRSSIMIECDGRQIPPNPWFVLSLEGTMLVVEMANAM